MKAEDLDKTIQILQKIQASIRDLTEKLNYSTFSRAEADAVSAQFSRSLSSSFGVCSENLIYLLWSPPYGFHVIVDDRELFKLLQEAP